MYRIDYVLELSTVDREKNTDAPDRPGSVGDFGTRSFQGPRSTQTRAPGPPAVSARAGAVIATLILLFFGFADADAQVARAPARADSALLVTAREEASRVGVELLRSGGNAVDAAAGIGFALAVTHPRAGNIGGGGFMLLRGPEGETRALDFREEAPQAATRTMYQNEAGDVVPSRSRLGHLASGVPGTVAGLLYAQAEYGRLSREAVLQPAIDLAADGFHLTEAQAERLNEYAPTFRRFPGSRQYFTKETGETYRPGDRFVQEDLAGTLRRIRDRGKAGFYEGRTAELIVEEMERGGGIIDREDLRRYHVVEREPVSGTYRGYRIHSMPPPSSGGVAIIQLLNGVRPYDLGRMGYHSSRTVHLMGETMRRVYADRAKWLGDPEYFPVPIDTLVDPVYMRGRMASFDPYRADTSARIPHGDLAEESRETTHYTVVDSAGRAVAVTYTLNGSYGSKVAVPGAGFFLNNEMDDFSAKPGVPNMYGLIGGEANAIEPGKRMLSSMSPTIVEDPVGRLFMALGTPGGGTIITTVFQMLVNVLDFDMNVQQAVTAGRIHHQYLPDTLYYEPRVLSRDVRLNLRRRGWNVATSPYGYYGRANAIRIRYAESGAGSAVGTDSTAPGVGSRTYLGGRDPRGSDQTALGY